MKKVTKEYTLTLELPPDMSKKLKTGTNRLKNYFPRSTKTSKQATKKLSLRVWAHSLGEYLYILTKNGLTLRHRTYTINQTDDGLLE